MSMMIKTNLSCASQVSYCQTKRENIAFKLCFTCISYGSLLVFIKKGLLLFFMPAIPNFVALKAVLNIDEGSRAYANYPPWLRRQETALIE